MIRTINDIIIYLSQTDKFITNKFYSDLDVETAFKTHGQCGYKDSIFNYVYSICSQSNNAYECLYPLAVLSKDSENKIKLMNELKEQLNNMKKKIGKRNYEHENSLSACLQLFKVYAFKEVK